MLNFLGSLGWVSNNVFIVALIAAVAGSMLGWGIAAGASALSWIAFFVALLMYFLGGLGDGINKVQRSRILTRAGFDPLQIALLDEPIDQLDEDDRALVRLQRDAVADHFNLHASFRETTRDYQQAGLLKPMSAGERQNVINDFGEVLEQNAHLTYGAPESLLPHPRARYESSKRCAKNSLLL